MKRELPKLKDYCIKISSGGTPSRDKNEYFENGTIPWVKSKELKSNIILETEEKITLKGLKNSSTKLYPIDTVLLAMYGVNIGQVGYLGIEATINQAICGIITNKDILDPKYLYYYLTSIQSYFDSVSFGAAQQNINQDLIKNLKIKVPDILTQQSIASILSAYDDLIEVNNQRIKLLEETARELYKEWFVRMRFPGYKKVKFVKGVPEGWEIVRLDNVLSFKTGKLNSNASTLDGKYPFFTCSNADYKTDTYSFDTEAVLLAGNNAAGIYPLKYYKGKFDAYQRTYIIKPKSDDISHKYVYYYFLERLEFLQTISIGAATQFLTTQMLKKLLMFLPNKNLMLRFSIIVDPIFEQVQILNQQNTQLRQIRDRLLPRLISGKLEVKEIKQHTTA